MKEVVASHKIERDELLEQPFVPRHSLAQAVPSFRSATTFPKAKPATGKYRPYAQPESNLNTRVEPF